MKRLSSPIGQPPAIRPRKGVTFKDLTPPPKLSGKRPRPSPDSPGEEARGPRPRYPITVASALERLLHHVLVRRLSKYLQLNHLQRDFVQEDGVLANAIILDQYMTIRRASRKSYNVASSYVRKAFNTISHRSIWRALQRHGVGNCMGRYIMNSLGNATTTITISNATTDAISFRRGVKQGDPLSPLLFNMVMDELLDEINNHQPGGTISPDTRVAAMAFADDIVLLEDREVDMALSITRTADFLRARGMDINVKKSVTVSAAVISGRSFPRTRPIFRYGREHLPIVGVISMFRYLGHTISGQGIVKPSIHHLADWLSRLGKAPLKHRQKLEILRTHLVPKLHHGLQVPSVTSGKLRATDRLIKHHVKSWLHLSNHTDDQFIHAKVRDGGLGIPCLLWESRRFGCTPNSVREKANPKIQTPNTILSPAQYWREEISSRPMSRGMEFASDDPASRTWIRFPPPGWTGRDFVRAVQLRTANLPTMGLPYHHPEELCCRPGCPRVESLLGGNPYPGRFLDAEEARLWPGRTFHFLPVVVGARGVWPRANSPTVESLRIPLDLRQSIVTACVQWGSSIHRSFMAGVWKRDPTIRRGRCAAGQTTPGQAGHMRMKP
ncbi:Reverse transcriptase (RNA-dependent DNA polymerase) [Popillia japonica]|uniref:Reverse transcriptase (RNA-dependent DNA polymerase) n=1 Tax=Popillia japonica TaxID=7064 RepID=A0AAW1MLW4_POPJA